MKKEVYRQPLEVVLSQVGVSPETGLSKDEAKRRLISHGPNISVQEQPVSAWKILLRQFKSFIIYVLLFAAIASYAIRSHEEFYVIAGIIVFIIMLSFFEEYKATKEMEALRKLTPRTARVIRDGAEEEIQIQELVPGDVLILRRGDVASADCRVISSNNLGVDESILTGESMPVVKEAKDISLKKPISEQKNMVFSSTHITNGNAACLVVVTGKETEIGGISSLVSGVHSETTPLQKRLDRLSKQFSVGVLLICTLLFLFGIIRGQSWESVLLLAVAVAVSGIPESLPAVIGVALAIGMKRMAKQGAIIKRLPAVETLGTCTVICTDKTGTLTQNRMVIERIFTIDDEINVTGSGLTPKGLFMREKEMVDPKKHQSLSKILEIGTLCNNASIIKRSKEWHVDGESTEGALIVMAKKAGIERNTMHEKFPRLHEHPFDPDRKCMSSVHKVKNKAIVYAKGAPEMLLKKSTHYLDGGTVRKLTPLIVNKIINKTDEFASSGRRVLGLAYKEHKGKTYELRHVESSLVFAGLVSMRDPPSVSAFSAVRMCKEAGIKPIMITGDNVATAKAIAEELGIWEEGNAVLTGNQLDRLSDQRFTHIIEHVTVYARTTPKHKLRIVQALQTVGHIVAMTGDGVNDAPALKKADIGVAMGKDSTEVAKEAAEMVIMDNNFATIVAAVREGRTIFENIRKFLYYLLAGNFSEVILIFIAALLGIVPPLTPLMILFINLVTSDIPAIGLCMEKPKEHIMQEKPRNPREGIMTEYLFLKIAGVVPIMVLGAISLYLWELVIVGGDLARAQTLAFVAIIVFELFHVFNAKSFTKSAFSKDLGANPYIFVGVGISIAATLLTVYWRPLGALFGTVPLSLVEWLFVLFIGSIVLLIVEVEKTMVATEIKERDKMEIYPTRG
ncbi:MAG: HAD-IC family P-type ATPase [archaeon]